MLRTLGSGAEGVVYLAHDPKLGREVAIKTLSMDAADDQGHAERLVLTAKIAGTLSHPNIVPVFEADMHEGCPYVVFEYVEGRTLAQQIAADGPLPMARAVVMMSQILAGVTLMHERRLIHGDIKPSNILVGANELARVSDFGLSRHERAVNTEASGTVRYMAPECFEGGANDCRRDVYALGLVLHEMLTGEPVIASGNVHTQMYLIFNDLPPPPSARNARIAPAIDVIVLKALQKNPAERYANAGEMKRELDRFRVAPAASERVELHEQNVHSTVEFLVRRMAHKSDFPALSASFSCINQISTQTDDASIKTLSDTVMRDFALTQKLLRLVNSAATGAGKVTKVSQAITILGVGQLRAVATAMMLANGAAGKKSPGITTALTDAFVTGLISRNIGRLTGLATVEELFICGMFSPLGDLLAQYYLAEEHAEIARRVTEEKADPAAAARAVLGLTFDELGVAMARHWQFPPAILTPLSPLPAGTLAPAPTPADRMWHCAGYARELCALARIADPVMRENALAAHIARFARTIAADATMVRELMTRSVDVAGKYTAAAGFAAAKTPMLDGMSALCSARAAPPLTPTASAKARPATIQARMTTDEPDQAMLIPQAGLRDRLARAWRSLF